VEAFDETDKDGLEGVVKILLESSESLKSAKKLESFSETPVRTLGTFYFLNSEMFCKFTA